MWLAELLVLEKNRKFKLREVTKVLNNKAQQPFQSTPLTFPFLMSKFIIQIY